MHTAAAKPTKEQFDAYRALYRYFNRELFAGELPEVLLNFSRRAHSRGFFAYERWNRGDGSKTHEISLNPDTLSERSAEEVASTLVHEMVHLWQAVYGTPSRSGYHNREWASKMEAVGLMPSSTGEPGGARVGQHMTHYIVAGGPFALAFASMSGASALPWKSAGDGARAAKRRDPSKVKYTCAGCGANVWGKTGLRVRCEECDLPFAECDELGAAATAAGLAEGLPSAP